MIGKKLEECPGMDSKAALMLSDSVVEAQRLAAMELKNREGKNGKDSKGGDDEDDGEGNSDMKLFKKKTFAHQKGFNGGKSSFARKRKRV